MIELVKKILPPKLKKIYHKHKQDKIFKKVASLPELDETGFRKILTEEIGISSGDTVFVHSGIGLLNLSFQSYNTLGILLDVIGDGTLIMPTYPKENSYKFLSSGQEFNIKKTPTYTGLLNEYARRHKSAIRSLHPTKSVVAIGKNAIEITNTHQLSIYPYSEHSPYYKINKFNTRVIGIGVPTTYLSMVHSVEDTLLEKFPVDPYYPEVFEAKCIDYDGREVIVKTKAHDMRKMHFDLPKFFANNVEKSICRDIDISGMKFFSADSSKLYDKLCELAEENITIYAKKFHRRSR